LDALGFSKDGNRLKNAELALEVLDSLADKEGPALVEVLAKVEPITTIPALARSMAAAGRVANAIEDNNWSLLTKVWSRPDGAGGPIKKRVQDALSTDELVTSLAEALKQAQQEATQLIDPAPTPQPPEPPTPPKPPRGKKVLRQDNHRGLDASQAKQLLDEIQAELSANVTLDISYTIVGED
jgi:hypothetical protein